MNGINTSNNRVHKLRKAYSESYAPAMKRIIKLRNYGTDTAESLVTGDPIEKLFRCIGEMEQFKQEVELRDVYKRNPFNPQWYGPNFNILIGRAVIDSVRNLLQVFINEIPLLPAFDFAEFPVNQLEGIKLLHGFCESLTSEVKKIPYFSQFFENNKSLYLQSCLYRIPDLATKTIERFYYVLFAKLFNETHVLPLFSPKSPQVPLTPNEKTTGYIGFFVNFILWINSNFDNKESQSHDLQAVRRDIILLFRVLLTYEPYKGISGLFDKFDAPNELKATWNRMKGFEKNCFEIQASNQMTQYVRDMNSCLKFSWQLLRKDGGLGFFIQEAYKKPGYLENHTAGVDYITDLLFPDYLIEGNTHIDLKVK